MSGASTTIGRRRRLRQAMAEMHSHLRAGRQSPTRTALSIWLGTIIGCLPLYGFHLPLCVAGGTLFRLSRVKCYLAAHVNNPFTLPFLLYLEAGIGHWLFTGGWLRLRIEDWREIGALGIGRDLFTGALVVGFVAGAFLAGGAYVISLRWKDSPFRVQLIDNTARAYLDHGVFDWEYVRGKLEHDPVYFEVLKRGVLPDSGHLVDLGCGRGILLALLRTAKARYASGDWPADWPPPPQALALTGVEHRRKMVDIARHVLGGGASIVHANLVDYDPPPCDAVLLLDVLHYLDADQQERLIRAAAEALAPGGLLLIREAAVEHRLRFLLTRTAERLNAIGRGQWRQKFLYRTTGEWIAAVQRCGLEARSYPMWSGTPFSNILLKVCKPARARAAGKAGDLPK